MLGGWQPPEDDLRVVRRMTTSENVNTISSIVGRVTDPNRNPGNERTTVLGKAVLLFGLGIPLVVLAGLYGGGWIAGFEFGDIIFALSAVTAVAWVVFAGWGRRMDAARPSGELFRLSSTDYGEEVAAGTYTRLPLPARVLFVLTGTVILGWIILLATLWFG